MKAPYYESEETFKPKISEKSNILAIRHKQRMIEKISEKDIKIKDTSIEDYI